MELFYPKFTFRRFNLTNYWCHLPIRRLQITFYHCNLPGIANSRREKEIPAGFWEFPKSIRDSRSILWFPGGNSKYLPDFGNSRDLSRFPWRICCFLYGFVIFCKKFRNPEWFCRFHSFYNFSLPVNPSMMMIMCDYYPNSARNSAIGPKFLPNNWQSNPQSGLKYQYPIPYFPFLPYLCPRLCQPAPTRVGRRRLG